MRKKVLRALMLLFMVLALIPLGRGEGFQAATSFENAKEFFESTGEDGEPYHVEMVNGSIYYATKAKVASSSTNLRYRTVGFDISLAGNDYTVSFAVKRPTNEKDYTYMKQIDNRTSEGYEYILYCIEDDMLFDLASLVDENKAEKILDAAVINVYMDAVLTTIQGNEAYGGVKEDGQGGLNEWGVIYHLNDKDDLKTAMKIFNGHTFESYKNIQSKLYNYLLQIKYNINGTEEANEGCSSTATVGNGYNSKDGVLRKGSEDVITASRVLKKASLVKPKTIELEKTGYHLEEGKEWTRESMYFSANKKYMPKKICPEVGYKDKNIFLYANWKPNNYTITYDANGGSGTIAASKFVYDQEGTLRKNTFTRTGYVLVKGEEWNTKADGTGKTYGSNEVIKNLTSEDGKNVVLYANWQSSIVQITTDKQGGTGGTDKFYEKYNVDFYAEKSALNVIKKISLPTMPGYNFDGYYTNMYGVGSPVVESDGKISIKPAFFTRDSVVYANYIAKQYTITFDRQGGVGGTSKVNPTYGEVLPFAVAPVWTGYTFKGYYTEKNGKGDMYYNEFMSTDVKYLIDGDTTLYAYWVDDSAPTVTLTANIDVWTNRDIILTADAYDYGVGLSSLKLYQDGVLVAEKTNLNGDMATKIRFTNTEEGAITYKAVATDMNGNTAEIYEVIKYDKTKPQGTIIEENIDGDKISLTIDVTDMNVE